MNQKEREREGLKSDDDQSTSPISISMMGEQNLKVYSGVQLAGHAYRFLKSTEVTALASCGSYERVNEWGVVQVEVGVLVNSL